MPHQFSSAVITCEHAGNDVPELYRYLFKDADTVLQSHRGWDYGAIDIARFLAEGKKTPLFNTHVTRLLVEANRSLHSPELFSAYSNPLPESSKNEILKQFYFPYRNEVEACIRSLSKPILHLSIHTFTPVFNGATRSTDIGLLFDPERNSEAQFCMHFHKRLFNLLPQLQIDFNQPYSGTDDGFTTYLRTKFTNDEYVGLEIEVNQKWIEKKEQLMLSVALNKVLNSFLD